MGFTFNGVTSKSMKIRARLTSWQASPALRNFYETVPGKAGVADFGCDSAERTVKVECSVFPQKNFPALVAVLDGMAEWLDPTKGQGQLILDDVPNRYFMARLSEAVDCERLLRSAGQFTLSFICPDPYAYALTDETYIFSEAGTHMAVRHTGNTDSYPVYAIFGERDSIREDYEAVKERLYDTSELETERIQLQEEMNIVAEMIQQCVNENARVALDQTEYQKKYDGLAERFDRIKERLEAVGSAITERMAKREKTERFLAELEKRDGPLTEFNEEDWYSLVEYATVYSREDIRFTFKNGIEIKA